MPHFIIVLKFFKPQLLDNKMYIFEEYGAFKQGFTLVYIIILISDQKYRLWILVRIESPSRFYRVPKSMFSRSMKNVRVFI